MSHLQCFSAQSGLTTKFFHPTHTHESHGTLLPAMPTPQYPSFQARSSSRELSVYVTIAKCSDRRPSNASSGLSTESNNRSSPSGLDLIFQ
ncbi:hypothetical protein TNCT_593001 [Trichonephila clavata]|uniref:Uncharacterized protein n=1 Tax=Trichonephila clavata TaxID=2740835 RepID=A0A8X6LYC2_TRICU|nr:hypothetical protein TNCT_593001 [Trichonephila clavata]